MQVTKTIVGTILALILVGTTANATDYFFHNQADIIRERIPTVKLNVFAPHNRVQRQREVIRERVIFVDKHGRVVEQIREVPVERQLVRDRIVTHDRFVQRGNVVFLEKRDNRGRLLSRERVRLDNRQRLRRHQGNLFLEQFDRHGRRIQQFRVH